jgi:hypothetical protein
VAVIQVAIGVHSLCINYQIWVKKKMRRIRVRAWHFQLKKMFSPEEMAQDQMTLLPTGEFINVHSTSTRLSTIIPHTLMLPLQSTGLRDKNFIEVFEGDIIKEGGLVAVIEWDCEKASYCYRTKTATVGLYLFRGEKIGNKFENPELLV